MQLTKKQCCSSSLNIKFWTCPGNIAFKVRFVASGIPLDVCGYTCILCHLLHVKCCDGRSGGPECCCYKYTAVSVNKRTEFGVKIQIVACCSDAKYLSCPYKIDNPFWLGYVWWVLRLIFLWRAYRVEYTCVSGFESRHPFYMGLSIRKMPRCRRCVLHAIMRLPLLDSLE